MLQLCGCFLTCELYIHRMKIFVNRLTVDYGVKSMEEEMNINNEAHSRAEGLDECNVSEDENVNEVEELDFKEIDFRLLNEDEVKKYRFLNNDIAYKIYKMYGFRDKKNELVQKRAPRKESRCGCLARMKIHIDKEKKIVSEHYVAMIASNRKITEADVAQMNTMREVGIGTRKLFGSFAGQCGEYQYIGFSKKDMYNKIQKQRIIGNGDAESALQYLKEQSKSDCTMY
ncbi:hypothetical protein Lal_00028365 [Lupinus albus]|nr:hypothetical protein Lal_00028365 [Lupinus albus]